MPTQRPSKGGPRPEGIADWGADHHVWTPYGGQQTSDTLDKTTWKPIDKATYDACLDQALPHDRRVRNVSPGKPHPAGWLETALFTAMAVNPHFP